MATILITGGAGFIGSHLADPLLDRGDTLILVDNFNDYYDPSLKRSRVAVIKEKYPTVTVYEQDFAEIEGMRKIFAAHKIDKICHLGAQAGVRYSLTNPFAYTHSNIIGTTVIFELAKEFKVPTVVYASSSSVYGGNKKVPFSEKDAVDKPVSLYAATKKSCELIAHTYHHLYGIKCTGLRFFTVYGAWGRPDMAYFSFTKNILEGKPIKVFNHGKMKRDFTFIGDIVPGIIAALDKEYEYEVFNLGNSQTVSLMEFIETIENLLGVTAKKEMTEMQAGDVVETFADVSKAKEMLGYSPGTTIKEGLQVFIEWYKEYYKIQQ